MNDRVYILSVPPPHSTTISGNVPVTSFFCRLPSLVCVQDAWSLLIQVAVHPHAFCGVCLPGLAQVSSAWRPQNLRLCRH